jgi:predicted nucleotidyltransferase
LAELFGRPVDLVSKATLHRVIRDDVLAEAQSLYAP